MSFLKKIIAFEGLPVWREAFRGTGKKLVVTNGCFDLLHPGHVTCLAAAHDLGDTLLVGVNDDASVRTLKGEGRPLNSGQDRATVLAALEAVDAVCVFPGVQATAFLSAAQPDVWIKGGDCTLAMLPQDERHEVERYGGRIVIIPFVPGKSTSSLLQKIQRK